MSVMARTCHVVFRKYDGHMRFETLPNTMNVLSIDYEDLMSQICEFAGRCIKIHSFDYSVEIRWSGAPLTELSYLRLSKHRDTELSVTVIPRPVRTF